MVMSLRFGAVLDLETSSVDTLRYSSQHDVGKENAIAMSVGVYGTWSDKWRAHTTTYGREIERINFALLASFSPRDKSRVTDVISSKCRTKKIERWQTM